MTNIVKFGGGTGLMTQGDLASSLSNMSMAAPRVGGDYQFLKLDKGTGAWIYGQDETEVEDGSQWAVNPHSLEYGYISWDANQQVEGEVMVPITRPLPVLSALRTSAPDGQTTGQNGWQYQQSVVLACISGEDAGVEVQYKQSSVGSRKLFKALTDAIATQVQKGSDAIVPLVEMKSDSYKHKKYGKIHNPIFEVMGWATIDGEVADDKKAAEKPTEKAPAKVAAPEPASDEEAELEAEYAAAAAENPTPRRRTRRG